MSNRLYLNCLVLLLFIIGCEAPSSPPSEKDYEIDPNYPTTIYPLSDAEWQILQTELDSLNDSKLCTNLNAYGFTEKQNYFAVHPNPNIKITKAEALQIALDCLNKNKKFTNISDTSAISKNIVTISPTNTDSTCWVIRFGNQSYHGYEILKSHVSVVTFGDGVYYILGCWYLDIFIPSIENVDIEQAKSLVTGESIIWAGYNGEPHEFIVTEESIIDSIVKVIYPVETDSSLELRVTWKIPIRFLDFAGWHIYLDTSTGDIITIIQEFRT